MFQPTNTLLVSMLKDAKISITSGDFDGILSTVKLGLIVNNPTLTQDTVLADLEEPVYPTYVRQAITWDSLIGREPSGDFVMYGGTKLFQMDDASVPTVITGAFIVKEGTPSLVLGVTLFDDARALTNEFDVVPVEVELALSAAGFTEGPNVD